MYQPEPGVMCSCTWPVLLQVLEGYPPDVTRLPDLMVALARDVDWSQEQPCFRGLAQARCRGSSADAPGGSGRADPHMFCFNDVVPAVDWCLHYSSWGRVEVARMSNRHPWAEFGGV